MGRPSILMDWQNRYSQNVYTTQSNLHVQCNPYQNANNIFHRTRTNIPKPQKTLSSKGNLGKEKHTEGIIIPDFKLYYTAVVTNTTFINTSVDVHLGFFYVMNNAYSFRTYVYYLVHTTFNFL